MPASLPVRRWLAALAPGLSLAFGLALAAPVACGSSTETTPAPAPDSGQDGGTDDPDAPPPKPVVETLHPDAEPLPGESECVVVITTNIHQAPWKHVDTCADVDYATNPPSGGDHWSFWAAWKEYADPIPREVWVHNLEHGGVVLAYDCSEACPEVVAALQEASTGATPDPECIGFNARVLITPDPELDTPIAASAWGATYTATCIDPKSLAAFLKDRYAKGPEDTCAQGKVVDMLDGGLGCD